MHRFIAAVIPFLCAASVACAAAPDLFVGHDSQNGRILLGSLNCTACHEDPAASELLIKQAPNLSAAGSRITPQYLRAFLSDPQHTKPGTTMPHLLADLTEAQRKDTIEKLTHYLSSLGTPIDQKASGASLGEIHQGGELFHSVGCVACHAPQGPPLKNRIDEGAAAGEETETEAYDPEKHSAVPLGNLAMKTTVDALAVFLHDPLAIRAAGRMPSLSLAPGEPRKLAAYLLREQYTEDQQAPGAGVGFAYYSGSFSQVASMPDASPIFEGQSTDLSLENVAKNVPQLKGNLPGSNFGVRFFGLIEIAQPGEYRFWTKSDDGSLLFINNEKVIDNDGAHPPTEKEGRITLTKGRHSFELLFAQVGGGYELSSHWQPPGQNSRSAIPGSVLIHQSAAMIPKGLVDFQVDRELASEGKSLFASFGCASCHETGEKLLPVRAAALAALNPQEGCLSAAPKKGQPRFAVSGAQRLAMQQALVDLKAKKWNNSEQEKLHRGMAAYNCYACHQRGEIGGPGTKQEYFVYEKVVDLGDEGRLPPPLTGVGAKLTKEGFADALFSGIKYRTYMATRMPKFGEANIGHLPELFAKADAGKLPAHQPEFSNKMIDDGRFLIGKQALACINCHSWGPFHLAGAEGMDLQRVTRRIQPGWFHSWLKDPQALRPGTRMPTGWPDGKTFFPKIQGGDVDLQIDSVWAYLSVGPKGGMPPGLAPADDNLLTPFNEPIVFRTFADRISAHAILVGFRQRTHVAFDANRIRTALVWTGDFVSGKPSWDGRAGQYTPIPSASVVNFPEGPPWARLESAETTWPADRPKERLGSNRTPEGWRFRGYRLNKERIPTFIYEVGPVTVHETPGTEFGKTDSQFTQTFQLTSPAEVSDLYYRVASGKEITEKEGAYTVDGKVSYSITGASLSPFVRESEGNKELLVPVPLAQNKTQELKIEMTW